MIGHYVRLYLRQLARQKTYQLIGVMGLAVGIGAVMIIAAWIRFELSYDSFHAHADRLYRIYEIQEYPNGDLNVAVTPFPLGPALEREFPEIESTVRLWYGPGIVLSRGETRSFESGLIYADSAFFELFSYHLVSGDKSSALNRKNSAVVSKSVAEKYFGDSDPVGQTLRVNNQSDLLITGVMDDLPQNSHLSTGMVISLPTVSDDWPAQRRENWGSNGYSTYVLLHEGADRAAFDARLEKILTKFRKPDATTRLYSQKVTDIHLGPELVADNSSVADPKRLWVFASSALIVLLIACINYVNLATARAGLRVREFGVRSCLGAGFSQIRRQIVVEALVAAGFATTLAIVLVELSFPFMRDILNPSLPREALRDLSFLIILPGIWLIAGLSSGLYPALALVRRAPSRMLRDHNLRGRRLRHGLVVLQFAASIILIVLTFVILRQENFMRSSTLAAHADQVLIIPLRGEEARTHYAALREQLRLVNGVSSVSAVAQLPHQIVWSSTYNWEGQDPSNEVLFNTNYVDEQFLETFGLSLAQGRNVRDSETDVCLINECAAKQMGWQDAVGRRMFLEDSLAATVIGVIKDFHFSSMRDEIAPLVVFPSPEKYSNLAIRVVTDDLPQFMKEIETTSTRVLPNTPYRSFFMDQAFDRLYVTEMRMQRTISFFAALAIILACLGLFGLATFSIERRTKEVGIRKVLGAGVASIIGLHIREHVGWVVVANVLALPIAYWAGNKWLEGFAYRAALPWWIFVCAGVATLALAMSTVLLQTVRAASANPVKALRYE